ncbi:hypothetical protein JQK15_25515 [Sphingobium sp. BHU LFT2]|uniref:hypothetical protein n=1 Tax=Sphingobium sp. BHU LFT2 TaxID=2807634 RepID=UPI001BEB771F|nr:hypothetical protein [Sphingobium sp. BHU LFT2]MBT2246860.1 hypothetical protein [Sphingobium sp. BHU LFT2]
MAALSQQLPDRFPYHAFVRAQPYVEIELKPSPIDDPKGQATWAVRLGTAAREALDRTAL